MDKDFELKNNAGYLNNELRKRINNGVKQLRDTGDEMKEPSAKTLPIIPVTGQGGKKTPYKYYQNKSHQKI